MYPIDKQAEIYVRIKELAARKDVEFYVWHSERGDFSYITCVLSDRVKRVFILDDLNEIYQREIIDVILDKIVS